MRKKLFVSFSHETVATKKVDAHQHFFETRFDMGILRGCSFFNLKDFFSKKNE